MSDDIDLMRWEDDGGAIDLRHGEGPEDDAPLTLEPLRCGANAEIDHAPTIRV